MRMYLRIFGTDVVASLEVRFDCVEARRRGEYLWSITNGPVLRDLCVVC